ncbi:MAG TPA: hypothetical protein VEB64_17240 [Azospirillaceae bacterium]|nr:hypothetical protein [Azospirillaceae bacterium]
MIQSLTKRYIQYAAKATIPFFWVLVFWVLVLAVVILIAFRRIATWLPTSMMAA